MKALSIKEPWASMILSGEKTIETRTWKTNFRGTFLVVGSLQPKGKCSGKAVATVELYDCKPMTIAHEKEACCPVYPRAYSWFLRNVKPLEKPFPVKGKLSFYEVDMEE